MNAAANKAIAPKEARIISFIREVDIIRLRATGKAAITKALWTHSFSDMMPEGYQSVLPETTNGFERFAEIDTQSISGATCVLPVLSEFCLVIAKTNTGAKSQTIQALTLQSSHRALHVKTSGPIPDRRK